MFGMSICEKYQPRDEISRAEYSMDKNRYRRLIMKHDFRKPPSHPPGSFNVISYLSILSIVLMESLVTIQTK